MNEILVIPLCLVDAQNMMVLVGMLIQHIPIIKFFPADNDFIFFCKIFSLFFHLSSMELYIVAIAHWTWRTQREGPAKTRLGRSSWLEDTGDFPAMFE